MTFQGLLGKGQRVTDERIGNAVLIESTLIGIKVYGLSSCVEVCFSKQITRLHFAFFYRLQLQPIAKVNKLN